MGESTITMKQVTFWVGIGATIGGVFLTQLGVPKIWDLQTKADTKVAFEALSNSLQGRLAAIEKSAKEDRDRLAADIAKNDARLTTDLRELRQLNTQILQTLTEKK